MKKINNSVCCGCTCLCDDIGLSITDDGVVESKNACELGAAWFESAFVSSGASTSQNLYQCDGKPVELADAIKRTMELIRQSKSPMVAGLDGISTQSQIEAVKFAKQIGAAIDTTLTRGQRGGMKALQSVGKVTASLGEVASRSDTIVFWYCDPVTTHPRFIERFCRSAKRIIVVDETKTATAKAAGEFIKLNRDGLFEILSKLRRRAQDGSFQLLGDANSLWSKIENASYGAHVYGPVEDHNVESLYMLVRGLNSVTRSVALGLRQDRNANSAENVLAWNTGFPGAVSFRTGAAEYNGPEYSAERVLENGECDFALLFSGHALDSLSKAAQEHVSSIPSVVFGNAPTSLRLKPKVEFRIGFDFGDWSRMDDVLLPVGESSANEACVSAILKRLAAEAI